jgi:hypothetical protein
VENKEEKKIKVESPEAKPVTKRPVTLYILLGIAALALLGGGFYLFTRHSAQAKITTAPLKKSPLENGDKKDLSRAKVIMVDPAAEQNIILMTDKKVLVTVDIPKGVFKSKHKIAIVPFKTNNPANPVKILIFPQDLSFKKPVTISFDLSRTEYRNTAPEFITTEGRVSGNTQLLFTDRITNQPFPALISRSTETGRYVTARILGTGLYSLTTDGAGKSDYARAALASKNADVLTVLESASAILFKQEKLTEVEKKLAMSAVSRIKNKKDGSAYDMYAAYALSQALTGKKASFSLIRKAEAAGDPYADYLKFACGDSKNENHPETLAILANTAKLAGFPDVEQKCMDHARTIVAERSRKLLSGNPTTQELLAQIAENKSFKLPDATSEALQNRINQNLTKEIQDLVNKGATKEELVHKLTEAQAYGKISDKLTEIVTGKIAQRAYEDAKKVADDPRSTPQQIVAAMADAQLHGMKANENEDIMDALKRRMNRSSREILDSKDSTWGEILHAYEMETDPALHEELLKRKNEEFKKLLPTRTPTKDQPTPEVTDAEQGVDGNIMAVAFFQMLGGTTFDEEGLKKLGQEKADQAHKDLDQLKEICPDVLALMAETGPIPGFDTGAVEKQCSELTSGATDRKIDDLKRDIDRDAEKVGEGQKNYDSFSDNEDDWHITIEFTPTPGGDENGGQSTDEWGGWTFEEDGINSDENDNDGGHSDMTDDNDDVTSHEDELNNENTFMQAEDTQDNGQQQEVEQNQQPEQTEDVQGVHTYKKIQRR